VTRRDRRWRLAADVERRELAGVPDGVMFARKPQLADDSLQYAHDRGLRTAFIVVDRCAVVLACVRASAGAVSVTSWPSARITW
jgi:hypothetical protein